MKRISETHALFLATIVSSATIDLSFGFAWMMRLPHGAGTTVSVVDTAHPAESALTPIAAEAKEGRHLFLMNCAHCHGTDARGDEGPDLHDLHKSDGRIRSVITGGI